jgi:hypothetical protein
MNRLVWMVGALLCLAGAPRLCHALNAGEVELTREGKASIAMGLQYLSTRQRADGSFSGQYGDSPAGVAAACLAFMAEGNLPGEGQYGKQVAKAVDWLLNATQNSGLIGKTDHSYQHGMGAICLAEVWGHTRDKRIYTKLKKAITLTIQSQNDKGGWHYNMKNDGTDDLSTTVMQLMALRAAKDAGISVPKETIDKAVAYVESCRTSRDGAGNAGFAYTPGGGIRWSTTALGVMSLMLCGGRKPTAVKDGLDFLLKARQNKQDSSYFVYGHYYGAMAMYQAGGHGGKYLDYWKQWYPDISNALIKSQETSGNHRGLFKQDTGFGFWSEGMCLMILAIPYRYLPVYQR